MVAQFVVPGSVTLRDVSRPANGETETQRLWRLAAKGHIEGVRVMRVVGADGMFCATSSRTPDTCYAVDAADRSCSCEGYGKFGVCKHVALVLASLGELPEPEPPVPAFRCDACADTGRIEAESGLFPGTYHRPPCPVCVPRIPVRIDPAALAA